MNTAVQITLIICITIVLLALLGKNNSNDKKK